MKKAMIFYTFNMITTPKIKPMPNDLFSSFILWKKEGDKWVQYAGGIIFSTTKNSNSYNRATRLMMRGWIPYGEFCLPEYHQPMELFNQDDYEEYEKYLRSLDPLGYLIGDCMREFVVTSCRKKIKEDIRYTFNDAVVTEKPEVKEMVLNMALKRAVEDYRNGKNIPTFLMKDVLNYFSNSDRSTA